MGKIVELAIYSKMTTVFMQALGMHTIYVYMYSKFWKEETWTVVASFQDTFHACTASNRRLGGAKLGTRLGYVE